MPHFQSNISRRWSWLEKKDVFLLLVPGRHSAQVGRNSYERGQGGKGPQEILSHLVTSSVDKKFQTPHWARQPRSLGLNIHVYAHFVTWAALLDFLHFPFMEQGNMGMCGVLRTWSNQTSGSRQWRKRAKVRRKTTVGSNQHNKPAWEATRRHCTQTSAPRHQLNSWKTTFATLSQVRRYKMYQEYKNKENVLNANTAVITLWDFLPSLLFSPHILCACV